MIRRFFRILGKCATMLSLVLCVAAVVLWIRSFWIADFVSYQSDRNGICYNFDILEHGLVYVKSRWESAKDKPTRWAHWSFHRGIPIQSYGRWRDPSEFGFFDPWSLPYLSTTFDAVNDRNTDGFLIRWLLPHWLIVLASSLLPALAFRRLLARRRAARKGLCVTCGYDLRATPQRCPECGRVPGTAHPTAT